MRPTVAPLTPNRESNRDHADQSSNSSLAREALKTTLEADAHLTLRKNKSWLGSMKDVFQRGALQAKAAVDTLKGDGGEGKKQTKFVYRSEFVISMLTCAVFRTVRSEENVSEDSCRPSLDSRASTTPLRSRNQHSQRRGTLTPRGAMHSLRNHVGKGNKRESLHSIVGRKSLDTFSASIGPERLASPAAESENGARGHGRKNSLAGSLVGSLRGLSKKSSMRTQRTQVVVPAAQEPEACPSPDRQPAETVPLPSSPIDVPVVAPAITLNLEAMGTSLMPSGFAASPERSMCRKGDFKGAETVMLPLPDHLGAPNESSGGELVVHRNCRKWPATPASLLGAAGERNAGPGPLVAAPLAPPTPMPGTTHSLEMDGADDSGDDQNGTQMFERSVTPSDEKGRKAMRSMHSLDAMAEANAGPTPTKLQAAQMQTSASQEHIAPHECSVAPVLEFSPPATMQPQCPPSDRSDLVSMTTHGSVPSDMPHLERMDARTWDPQSARGGLDAGEEGLVLSSGIEDPFDDVAAAADAAPHFPTPAVELPFRLRTADRTHGLAGTSLNVEEKPVVPLSQYRTSCSDASETAS